MKNNYSIYSKTYADFEKKLGLDYQIKKGNK